MFRKLFAKITPLLGSVKFSAGIAAGFYLLSTQRSQSTQSYRLYRLIPLTDLDSFSY